MRKIFLLSIVGFLAIQATAQTKQPVAGKYEQPYGVIDTADLTMKACDFDKDANAEVLLNKGDETFDEYLDITFVVHKRIKIFNENGKDQANIQIPFIDRIVDIKAQTINLTGKTITYTPVDVNLIYKQKVASKLKQLVFTFPDVRAGSVIELQYKWKIHSDILPSWYFQEDIPTRYSEIVVSFEGRHPFTFSLNNRQALVKDTMAFIDGKDDRLGKKYIHAMANIPAFKDEPYMAHETGVKQRLALNYHSDFWVRVYWDLNNDLDFGGQLDYKLSGEAEIAAKMNAITNKEARTDSIFNFVKKKMKWNNINTWYTNDGVKRAWSQKTGNSTEINLILYRLLGLCNIESYPMVVSTSDNGLVDPDFASLRQFNKTAVYVPVDSTHYYVLDASDQHSLYNVIPLDLLSNYGFKIAPKKFRFSLFRIGGIRPSKQLVYVKATIQPNGKMSGEANIVSDTYNRSTSLELYKTLGEKKYINYLSDNDNSLKISSLKLDSAEQDSLPLTQRLNFDLDLTASDENYIYFNPNLFTSFGKNPFLSKDRVSDIDFNFNNTYIISGEYSIPDGYKIDALPASRSIIMEDKSITFKRIVGEQDGHILVRYVINRTRSYYRQDEYSALYTFYKEMFRMLDEQIVFKKS